MACAGGAGSASLAPAPVRLNNNKARPTEGPDASGKASGTRGNAYMLLYRRRPVEAGGGEVVPGSPVQGAAHSPCVLLFFAPAHTWVWSNTALAVGKARLCVLTLAIPFAEARLVIRVLTIHALPVSMPLCPLPLGNRRLCVAVARGCRWRSAGRQHVVRPAGDSSGDQGEADRAANSLCASSSRAR